MYLIKYSGNQILAVRHIYGNLMFNKKSPLNKNITILYLLHIMN